MIQYKMTSVIDQDRRKARSFWAVGNGRTVVEIAEQPQDFGQYQRFLNGRPPRSPLITEDEEWRRFRFHYNPSFGGLCCATVRVFDKEHFQLVLAAVNGVRPEEIEIVES